MTYLRLTIEPIPAASRLATLEKLLPQEQWDKLRRDVYRRANYHCQICGKEGRLHCHEVWQYNERTGYQCLRGFQALCSNCHGTKHLLFVRDSQQQVRLLSHFVTVNRATRELAEEYMRRVQQQQKEFDQRRWIVNYGEFNWRIASTTSVQQRRQYASLNYPRYR